jgi:hypothetical protein
LAKPKPPERVAEPESKPEPSTRRDLTSVLKDLAKEPQETLPEAPTRQREVASRPKAVDERPTIAEIDALRAMIRQQIEPCWNPPIGAVEAEDLSVRLLVRVDPSGRVRQARVLDTLSMALNPFFEAAADSARRAVLNDRCNPLQLPSDKYHLWKELELTFNPREMLG